MRDAFGAVHGLVCDFRVAHQVGEPDDLVQRRAQVVCNRVREGLQLVVGGLERGGTLLDVAELVHRDLAKNLKGARVWGTGVHDGSLVRGDYVLHDKDVVEIHT